MKSLTVEQIEARVACIAELALRKRGEAHPHIAEDQLYTDVLRAIAAGASEPAAMARAAIKVAELPFDRFYE